MKKKFKCSCGTHLIEIDYYNAIEWINSKTKKKHKENRPDLWIGIYDTHNPKTGRKYKKPKIIADTWFLGCQPYTKEMDNIMKFLEDIVTQYIIRRK